MQKKQQQLAGEPHAPGRIVIVDPRRTSTVAACEVEAGKDKVLHHDVSHLRSKLWREFSGPDAPRMDFVITLCDMGEGKVCPDPRRAPDNCDLAISRSGEVHGLRG
jgi:hypothetical protein